MSAKLRNPVVLDPMAEIGQTSAENDEFFLVPCFVDHPTLSTLIEKNTPKMFLVGRTGSGKSANFQMLRKNCENVTEIDLMAMAMDYVSNSDILRFLDSLGVDLDLMFQALWKHVLCLEFIRARFDVADAEKSRRTFELLADLIKRDDRKKSAIEYLRKWERRFWITMDENVKEMVEQFEKKASAEFGAELEHFRGNVGYVRNLSTERRAQLVARARNLIEPNQLAELNKVLRLLADYDAGQQGKHYFILIDRIDERWVDASVRFRLIWALIECLKAFRKIDNLNIVVSMRSDVVERVMLEIQDPGFQRDKYNDYFLRIVWTKPQLRELVEKRVNFLFRRKYTRENVSFEDVFPHKVGGKSSFDYMLERTLLRPRDIITFVNMSLLKAQGSTEVRPADVKSAEGEYSRHQLQSIIEEWKSAIPSLEIVLGALASKRERFELSELLDSEFLENIALGYDEAVEAKPDPFSLVVRQFLSDQTPANSQRLLKTIFSELYRIGAIGLKLSKDERFQYSHIDNPILNLESIGMENRVHIHPMLHGALSIDRRAS